ncbi:type II toxin-antitoxin system VapC family toxin [Acidicapsa ligni]|uniref:type II toxin-antitoxin system VapC family toxin n=1 Tax=Acidicapsa ligni TaxID=542300 RepID=UPI0021DFA4CC|nr:type II toxin-antitoxin system VapC family toxin [Acidicapsa ligni]
MRYLLDTHTYLWFRAAPGLLPANVLDILTDTSHQGYISIVTPWEIAIKSGTGKLEATALLTNFEARETAAGFIFAPPTTTQAILSGLLPRHHRDPFDLLLIAQAIDLRLPIISSDIAFDLYEVQRIWE